MRQRSGDVVYHTVIRENIRLAECPSFGQAIIQYDDKCAGAADYRALADEIMSNKKGTAGQFVVMMKAALKMRP